ncbi:hypothetical protein DL98DRAFT_588851 [Cadophora sp. DSE1049]|nr:hypothetical protein DL98DRAFT_588851 [Cadophora sp. DSE1049]
MDNSKHLRNPSESVPIPVPSGALACTYRILCSRCIVRLGKDLQHEYVFDNPRSKKYNYCTKQKSPCEPIPEYAAEEYDALFSAVRAQDQETVAAAAEKMEAVMQVAAAEAPKTQQEISLALLEETRALRREIAGLARITTEVFAALAAPAPAPATPRGSKRKAAGGSGGGRKRGPTGQFLLVEEEEGRPGGAGEEENFADIDQ